MKICLICVEIFAWGKHGGFGRATRAIGRGLANKGHQVFALVPLRQEQKTIEQLDGVTVLGYPPTKPWMAGKLARLADADVYHSCEPSLASYFALRAVPEKQHIATSRDPRDFDDWILELANPSLNYLQVMANRTFENNWLVRKAVRRMSAVYTTAHCLVPKVQSIYALTKPPLFLPTPVHIPDHIDKAPTPTVCYLSRLDRRKRPLLFLELATNFPNVKFLIAGKSRDKGWEDTIRQKVNGIDNVQFLGFIDQFISENHSSLLEQSWILVNTATREGLPNSFLEAAAHGCAILSHVDPDGFASKFGYHARADDFAKGLHELLEHRRWEQRGEQARRFAAATFETELALDLHETAYNRAVANSA